MKKMLKIMAMLLVIATVIFAAGCADKNKETSPAEEEATEQVNESTDEAPTTPAGELAANVTPSDDLNGSNVTKNVTEENITKENITEENITEENITNETK